MQIMQQVIRIRAIKDRADSLGFSLVQVCTQAGVPPSTPYRWLDGKADPRLGKYDATCGALERALEGMAADLRERLALP